MSHPQGANADVFFRHVALKEHRKRVLTFYDHFNMAGLLGKWLSIELLSAIRFLGVNVVAKVRI